MPTPPPQAHNALGERVPLPVIVLLTELDTSVLVGQAAEDLVVSNAL